MWIYYFVFFFFFSSRRRHTRCGRDWSSDGALPISSIHPPPCSVREGSVPVAHPIPEPKHRTTRRQNSLCDKAKHLTCARPCTTSWPCSSPPSDRKSVRVGKECRSRWTPYH